MASEAPSHPPAAPAPTVAEHLSLGEGQNGSTNTPSIPLEEDVMQCARLGEVALLQKMFGLGSFSATYKDEEGITPLHWAAINNQYATCDFLVKAGADVNAKGGEAGATPAMWAVQRCHYYVVSLLLRAGTDPLLVNGQGYTLLHLATMDGNAFLLLILLHQDIPIDFTDPQGHTSLMWAAYKGFPACVDLLLRWGANVNAADENGLNSLHWALVRGSQPCIQKIIEYGVDRFAQTADGKTPATVAQEMMSARIWHRTLSACGYDEDANPKKLPLGLTSFIKNRHLVARVFFFWPFLVIWVVFSILAGMPVYAGVPISLVAAFVMQRIIMELAQRGPMQYRQVHRTPFVAGVFAGTLFWIGFRWLFSILPLTFTLHPFFNIAFGACYGLTTYFYSLSLLEDPGYVPIPTSRNDQKHTVEELLRLWKYDEDSFCVQCMVRRPLRSKHCGRCGRCVAKHDHHCPWIYNCVGNDNLRHFFLYMLFMDIGIIIFIRLVLAYLESRPAPSSSESQCNVLPPALCHLVLRDTWTVVLALWTSLHSIWTTMLLVVNLAQISWNQTTYENMKNHFQPQTRIGASATTAFVSGSTSLGPGGAEVLGRDDGPKVNAHSLERKGSFFAQWKKLLGLDAVIVTASDASSGANNRRRQHPFSHGVMTNCRDFWCDPAPYFGQRTPGEALLDGARVNYTRMYDTPLRTRDAGGLWYRQVGMEDVV